MLLFGSVAKGTADGDSDIDLVAIFDDLDYQDRLPLKWRLEAACAADTGTTVDVWVTDWPEWSHRVSRVSSSFESHIQPHCRQLVDGRPDNHLVNWDKDIGMPTSNLEEAITKLDDVRKSLASLKEACHARTGEMTRTLQGKRVADQDIHSTRLEQLCADASIVIETSLKALTVTGGEHPQRTHSISVLLDNCPDVPARVLDTLEPLRENTISPHSTQDFDDITRWRVAATYGSDTIAEISLEHLERLARQLSAAAIVAATATDDSIANLAAGSDDKRLRSYRNQLQATGSTVASGDVSVGVRRWKPWPVQAFTATTSGFRISSARSRQRSARRPARGVSSPRP